jgi:hypothetical protein
MTAPLHMARFQSVLCLAAVVLDIRTADKGHLLVGQISPGVSRACRGIGTGSDANITHAMN